jgi:ABC-type long-subunit fatty acid transport system fused permease/ATPase subunit
MSTGVLVVQSVLQDPTQVQAILRNVSSALLVSIKMWMAFLPVYRVQMEHILMLMVVRVVPNVLQVINLCILKLT